MAGERTSMVIGENKLMIKEDGGDSWWTQWHGRISEKNLI